VVRDPEDGSRTTRRAVRASPELGAVPALHLHVDHRHFGSSG